MGTWAQRGLSLTLEGHTVPGDSGGGAVRREWVEESDMGTEPSADVLSTVIQEYAKSFLRK